MTTDGPVQKTFYWTNYTNVYLLLLTAKMSKSLATSTVPLRGSGTTFNFTHTIWFPWYTGITSLSDISQRHGALHHLSKYVVSKPIKNALTRSPLSKLTMPSMTLTCYWMTLGSTLSLRACVIMVLKRINRRADSPLDSLGLPSNSFCLWETLLSSFISGPSNL